MIEFVAELRKLRARHCTATAVKQQTLQTRLSALLMFNLSRESDRFKQRRVALNFSKEAKRMGWEPFPCMLEKAQKAIAMGTQCKT